MHYFFYSSNPFLYSIFALFIVKIQRRVWLGFKSTSHAILMAISYTREYEQLIIFDFKSDKTNLETIYKLLKEVDKDLLRVRNFIITKLDRINGLEEILDKLYFVEEQKVTLNNYLCNREFQEFIDYLGDRKVSYDDIINRKENILVFYEKISSCRFLSKELQRQMKKEDFNIVAKIIHEIQIKINKPILKYLLELHDIYTELFELQSNMELEKQKYENKLENGQHQFLLQEIHQSKQDYRRDAVLLMQGLLKTDRRYYHLLRRQLDDQYNKIIQNKLLQLNKLINYQDKMPIDEREFINALKETRRKYLRLQRYILQ